MSALNPTVVFHRLIEVLNADNGCFHGYSADQIERAMPPIQALIGAGFFADDPDNLDGSYWQMAAGEDTEAAEFFSREADAYQRLYAVLTEVFEVGDDPYPYKDALHQLVRLQAEHDAMHGGGPNWKQRWEKALAEAQDLVRNEL